MAEIAEHPFISRLREELNIPTDTIEQGIEYNCKQENIISLKIWGFSIEKISDIKGIEILTRLKALNLSGNNLK